MRSMYRVKQSSNTNLNTIDGRRIGKEGNYTYLHLWINVTMKSFHRLDFVNLVLFIIFKNLILLSLLSYYLTRSEWFLYKYSLISERGGE